ncbi:MAG: hypothetical protein V2B20_11345 [Pseudomonadota bacterium]
MKIKRIGSVFLSFLIFASFSGCKGNSEIEDAKTVVKATVNDKNAMFRDVKYYDNAVVFTAKPAVCGEVNAIDSSGKYNGYRKFAYADGKAVIEDHSSQDDYLCNRMRLR